MNNISHRTVSHPDGDMRVTRDGKKAVVEITMARGKYSPLTRCVTSYPDELLGTVLEVKGPAYACDEILRDESPEYVQKALQWGMLPFVPAEEFAGKRLLDFGCGSGASTAILARLFPETEIVGVEIDEKSLRLAQARAAYYGLTDRVRFIHSRNSGGLPEGIGAFDFISFSAVYEHLLPHERSPILQQVWRCLKPNGVLFINQTPNRLGLIEYHTTAGLPLINYIPDRLACAVATRFSKRTTGQTWDQLLRAGIRGGTPREIIGILMGADDGGTPRPLRPRRAEIRNDIELWYRSTSTMSRRSSMIKKTIHIAAYALWPARRYLLPSIIMAVRKECGDVLPR